MDKSKHLLNQNGLRATKTRLALLAILEKERHPIDAQSLFDQIEGIDLATVYRNLNEFTEKGITRSVRIDDVRTSYELAGRDHHHHITCSTCGRVEDVDACEIDQLIATITKESPGFSRITEHSLEFKGICTTCNI